MSQNTRSDTRNVKLGTCNVTFDGVDLGYTKGGVEFSVTTSTKKVMVDQFGESEIDEIIMGRSAKVKVPLAETTLENLVRIMPGATLLGNGGAKATGSVTFVTAPPVNGDKVTVNGVDYTFKTVPTVGNPNDLAIPGTINAAATALAAAINASTDDRVSQVTASAAAAVVTLTYDDNGVQGNLVTLAKTFVTGTNCTVSGATLSGGADDTQKRVDVTNGIGYSLRQNAKRLVLHPLANAPQNVSEDVILPLSNTAGQLTFAFKFDEERTFPVEFTAYPDSNSKILYQIGDFSVPAA